MGGEGGGYGGFGEGGVLEGGCEHYQKALIEKVTWDGSSAPCSSPLYKAAEREVYVYWCLLMHQRNRSWNEKKIQNNKDTVGLLWSPLSTWPCYLSLASKLMGRKNLVLQDIQVLTANVELWGWASYSLALIFWQTASAVILLQFKTLPIKHYFVFSFISQSSHTICVKHD